MTRADLVGWTLAELAFVLLFAIVATLLPGYKRSIKRNRELEVKARSFESAAQREIALKSENEELKNVIDEYRKNLRSTALPSCAEVDKTKAWLFTATITSANSFEIEGQRYTINELLEHFAPQIQSARKRGCVERVKIYFRTDVGTQDYDLALRRIGGYFYPLSLGPR